MFNQTFWNERRIAGLILAAGFALMMVAVYYFLIGEGRITTGIPSWMAGEPKARFALAGIATTTLGLALLFSMVRDAGEHILAPLGSAALILAASMWLTAEALSLNGAGWVYQLERNYISLICISIACLGGALIRTKLLPVGIGWVSLVWGVGWLAAHLLSLIPPFAPSLAFIPISIALIFGRVQPEPAAVGANRVAEEGSI